MLSIEFDVIYSSFLPQTQAYDLLTLQEDDAKQKLEAWLKSVRSNPRVRKMFTSFRIDHDTETIEFELKNKVDDDTDVETVTEMLALGLIWKWVGENYKSVLYTKQYIGSGQKKFYSQSAHMSEVHKMYLQAQHDFYGYIRDHGTYNNSYIKPEEGS